MLVYLGLAFAAEGAFAAVGTFAAEAVLVEDALTVAGALAAEVAFDGDAAMHSQPGAPGIALYDGRVRSASVVGIDFP